MTYRVNLIRWGDHNYHNYMGDQKIIMAVLPLLISQSSDQSELHIRSPAFDIYESFERSRNRYCYWSMQR